MLPHKFTRVSGPFCLSALLGLARKLRFSHSLPHGLLVTRWLHYLWPQVQTPAKKGTARKKTQKRRFLSRLVPFREKSDFGPRAASETSDHPSCGESAFDPSSPHCLEQGVNQEPPLPFPSFCVCPSFLGLFCPCALLPLRRPLFLLAAALVPTLPTRTAKRLGWPHTRGRWGGISEYA